MQCAQRFPARPADPDSSVFAELFPAPQSAPSQPNVPTAKAKQMHLNWVYSTFFPFHALDLPGTHLVQGDFPPGPDDPGMHEHEELPFADREFVVHNLQFVSRIDSF